MFHTTWFLTIYKDYLSGFRMFRRGEIKSISEHGGSEATTILEKLKRKQFEIPIYLRLINEKHQEVKQLLKYSKEEYVKRSRHGQQGCTRQDIKKIFHNKFKNADHEPTKIRSLKEVNVIMSYALLFARIPMMYEVVEFIKSAIPDISTETRLYKQKIAIAQKSAILDIVSDLHHGGGSDESSKKVYPLASSIYKYCVNVISENRLNSKPLRSSIFTYPLMKQAALLIVYRRIFSEKKDLYAEMLKRSIEFLKPVKQCSDSADQSLKNIAVFAEVYEQKLETIRNQLDTKASETPDLDQEKSSE